MYPKLTIRIISIVLLSVFLWPIGHIAHANFDHTDIGATTRIKWENTKLYLNDKIFLEQEINFIDLQGKAPGVSDYHRLHLFFCWKATENLNSLIKPRGTACGFIGVQPLTNGNKITGASFDLSLWDALEGEGNSCERRNAMSKVGDVQTFYVTCSTGVQVATNTPYLLKVQGVKRSAGKGEYWWSATLTNKSTGESISIGQIKNHAIDPESELIDLQNVYFYRGSKVDCDAVPVGDLLLSSIRNSSERKSKFLYSYNEKCIRADVYPDNQKVDYIQVRFGGANPTSRDPNYKSVLSQSPTPSATSGVTPSPLPSTNTKPFLDEKSKPATPSFNGVNFVGNKFNINVSLGSLNVTRPEKVYLVAPSLGISAANPLLGTVFGNSAAWSIDLEKVLAGSLIPIEVVGERGGVFSEPLNGSYQAPANLTPLKSIAVPDAPKNFKSRIVGTSALVTVETTLRSGAIASNAYIFGKSLGIPKSRAVTGDLVGEKVILEVPIRSSMAGKKYPVTVYFSNEKGESKPLNGVIAIPAAPKFVPPPTLLPKKDVKATICIRASQTRAFEGTACPPGWTKK
jgi:hypothetical protein